MTILCAVRTIYHVDDDPDFLEEVRAALSPLYAVRSFVDPRRLRKAVRSEPPDLLLLDLEMPGLSGHELLNRLRAASHTADTPVIFLTGRTDRQSKLKGLSSGLDDYICKPPDMEELAVRMANLLRRRPALGPVSARLHMERYREACSNGSQVFFDSVLSRAAFLLRRFAAPDCLVVRGEAGVMEFSGPPADSSKALRIVRRLNRILEKRGPVLALRDGYLEEAAPPALRFDF